MANSILTNSQSNDNKIALVDAWLASANDAVETLFVFWAYLASWRQIEGPVKDDLFMGVVRDLVEAGLGDWLMNNEAGFDELREAVTEVAK